MGFLEGISVTFSRHVGCLEDMSDSVEVECLKTWSSIWISGSQISWGVLKMCWKPGVGSVLCIDMDILVSNELSLVRNSHNQVICYKLHSLANIYIYIYHNKEGLVSKKSSYTLIQDLIKLRADFCSANLSSKWSKKKALRKQLLFVTAAEAN